MLSFSAMIFSFFLITQTTSEDNTSATLTTKAIELLKSNQKKEALKLLEKAFDYSEDPEQLKTISILLIEASPSDYPKRENYLLYLARYEKNHEDQWKWYKELGDRHFKRERLDEAEDWYLRALAFAQDQPILKYQLAWVYWNSKKKPAALKNFLEIYPKADESLQKQIRSHLTKLWWEMGPLPQDSFRLITQWDSEVIANFIHDTFSEIPPSLVPSSLQREMLRQIKNHPQTKAAFEKTLMTGLEFASHPCFLFKNLLQPGDIISKTSFLKCLKDKGRPEASLMLSFLKQLTDREDERFDRSEAELLVEIGSEDEALRILLDQDQLDSRSKEFVGFTLQVLLNTADEHFQKIADEVSSRSFEYILNQTNNTPLLIRLQKHDPEPWLKFEDELYIGRKKPKEFLLKRGSWLANQDPPNLVEISSIYTELQEYPMSVSEKTTLTQLENLSRIETTELPNDFGDEFIKAYEAWMEEIDRALRIMDGVSPELKSIVIQLAKPKIKASLRQMYSEIDELEVPEDWNQFSVSFEEKKEQMKQALANKYLKGVRARQ